MHIIAMMVYYAHERTMFHLKHAHNDYGVGLASAKETRAEDAEFLSSEGANVGWSRFETF